MQVDGYYLTARQAAEALGVTPATLYAYTSRGQLHSEPCPGRPRERRYFRDEIDRLRERKESRTDPSKAAARGLHWGSPVLSSSITLIHNGRLYYRGQDVLKLAAKASLEQIAELLWEADPVEHARLFEQPCPLSRKQLAALPPYVPGHPLVRLQMALPVAGAMDAASYDLRLAAVRQTGARILRLMATIVAGRPSEAPVHEVLQEAWAVKNAAAGDAIRTALVLSADHELNASAFTARCAASAGSSPYDTVSAALATLKGRRHGGESERVSALFAEAASPRRARSAVANRLRRGERVPGFGHRLYPGGDPRAGMLMRLAQAGGDRAQWSLARALSGAALNLLQDLPNLDFGLVSLARTYGLPGDAPLVLFALGRTVGWIAHAMEQYTSGELIRPRASYTGPEPQTD